MSKTNTIKVVTHPNSRNKFEFGGWPVKDYPSAISITNKGKVYSIEFDKVPLLSVYEDIDGDLGNLLLEMKLDEGNLNIEPKVESKEGCATLDDLFINLEIFCSESVYKNTSIEMFNDRSGTIHIFDNEFRIVKDISFDSIKEGIDKLIELTLSTSLGKFLNDNKF